MEPFLTKEQFKELNNAPNDIQMAITNQNGKIFVGIGSPLKWVNFTPIQIRKIAALFLSHAKEAEALTIEN